MQESNSKTVGPKTLTNVAPTLQYFWTHSSTVVNYTYHLP